MKLSDERPIYFGIILFVLSVVWAFLMIEAIAYIEDILDKYGFFGSACIDLASGINTDKKLCETQFLRMVQYHNIFTIIAAFLFVLPAYIASRPFWFKRSGPIRGRLITVVIFVCIWLTCLYNTNSLDQWRSFVAGVSGLLIVMWFGYRSHNKLSKRDAASVAPS